MECRAFSFKISFTLLFKDTPKMLTHTITINATHTMILLPILKPLDKTQPYYDEIFCPFAAKF